MNIDLNEYLGMILAGKNEFFGLIESYNRAIAIETRQFTYFCGKPQIYYLYKYPIGDLLLMKTYNNNQLLLLGELSKNNSMENLFNEAKILYDNSEHDILLDYIAAMIIKAQPILYQLFDMINKVAVFRGSSKNICYTFVNPFITCINIEPRYRTYGTGQLNTIINNSYCRQFKDIFFFDNCN
jgi:hypothetical protein